MSEDQGLTTAEKESAADIRVNERFDNDEVKFEPLFESEDVSEAELMGEEKPEKSSTEKEAASSESEDDKKEEPATEEKEETKETKEEEPKEKEPEKKEEDTKPPKGYVEIQALRQAREDNKALKSHLATLEKNIELLQSQQKKPEIPNKFKDFKVLSEEEFKELVAEDIEEALIYNTKLQEYNQYQAQNQQQQQIELARKQKIDSVIMQSHEKIAEEIPGIYDEDSDIQQNLYDFGVNNGFDGQFLSVMTNPATRIIPVGSNGKPAKDSYPLGQGAVSLVTMINKLHNSVKSNDPEKLRSEIKAEVEKELRAEISKEVIAKLKNNDNQEAFKSILDAPGGAKEQLTVKKNYSEKDFYNMTEAEERAALGG